ncbi:MAG: carbon storage regulator CsrA [Halanaerobiaceae bacterium]|jgi:carbon storage regulator|nr:carbon storage regulator CsrA [Halanaerobiaceae bacterium]
MLILTRKLDEEIIIGEDIKIRVVGIENGKVKLGIDAPGELAIIRGELYQEVERENREAVRKIEITSLKELKKRD